MFEESNNFCNSSYSSDNDSDSDSDLDCYESMEEIYAGSEINLSDFIFSFLLCCRKINLSERGSSTLLKFIKTILPKDNKIPGCFKTILRKLKINRKNEKNVCNICNRISEMAVCGSEFCRNSSRKLKKNFDKPATIFELEYMKQLKRVLKQNQNTIEKYKS